MVCGGSTRLILKSVSKDLESALLARRLGGQEHSDSALLGGPPTALDHLDLWNFAAAKRRKFTG